MKIVFAASEAAPLVKTGGLGDVARDLPLALSAHPDTEVSVFLPFYGSIKEKNRMLRPNGSGSFTWIFPGGINTWGYTAFARRTIGCGSI